MQEGAVTDKSGNNILFLTGLARGFTLGTVRVGGRFVLSDAAKPKFTPGLHVAGMILPQHEAPEVLTGDPEATAELAQNKGESEGAIEAADGLVDAEIAVQGSGGDDAEADEYDEGEIDVEIIEVDDENENEDGKDSGAEDQEEGGAASCILCPRHCACTCELCMAQFCLVLVPVGLCTVHAWARNPKERQPCCEHTRCFETRDTDIRDGQQQPQAFN